MKIRLYIPYDIYEKLLKHLLPNKTKTEEAAFLFASVTNEKYDLKLEYKEWYSVKPNDFLTRSSYHFELIDGMRAKIIKQGHDLDSSIIEFHSHLLPYPASFSPSDLFGFKEVVPHILWRLKNKPYIAIVVSPGSFDALIWVDNPNKPKLLDELRIENRILYPTNLSISKLSENNDIKKI